MSEIIQVEVPSERFAELERVAQLQHRTVDELIRDMIVREKPVLPPLPDGVEAELAAFEYLSDAALWLLATSTLAIEGQEELAALNEADQQRYLTVEEEARREILLNEYHRVILRRGQAAVILKQRGHDISKIIKQPE